MTQKKIKIYTHHSHFLNAGSGKQGRFFKKITLLIYNSFYYLGLGIVNSLILFRELLVSACFYVGNILITSAQSSLAGLRKDLSNTKKALPQRFLAFKNLQFTRGMFLFGLLTVVACLGLSSLHLVAKGLQLKSKILTTAQIGNSFLNQGKGALTSEDFEKAQNRFTLAYQTFSQGQQEIEQSGQALNALLSLLPQKRDADNLLAAAGYISKTGQDFVDLETEFSQLKLSAAGISSSSNLTGEIFSDITWHLASANSNIDEADSKIQQVGVNSLPGAEREQFALIKDQISNAKTAINNFSEVFSLLKSMILGNKTILVLFENNNELRASGGFIGTYGLVKVNDGNISKINVSSVYDLDGQLREPIKPPEPLLNVSDKWYLRDSNWFADFPATAQKVRDFYEREGGQTPDLIIALTPNIIVDWLKITGPINLPKYGVTLTSDNFVEQTQAISTISDGLPTNSPKQILADLVPILLQRLSSLDKSALPAVVESLQDNLNNKQIAIYSRDSQTETQLENFDWAGNLATSDRDYLSVVNSNLGGTKTDLNIDQQLSLTSTVDKNGNITDELTITRTNKLAQLPDTANLTFMRIYVPFGSKLVSNSGFDYKSLNYPKGEDYKIDNDAYNWEKNSVTDNLTGTMIGQESGKTFFGNWSALNGGETKTIKLVYQLPFSLANIDRYSLVVQKQLGSIDQKFIWNFNFSGYQIAWKNFDTTDLETNSLTSGIIVDKDYFMGMVLQKR